MQRPLRSHQRLVAGIVAAIAAGQTELADILAAVTPGGGKSLLPVIAAARLIEAGVVERVCWIVPRDSLRLQAEEAFADPAWRARPRPCRLGPGRRERARPLPRAAGLRHHLPGRRRRARPAPGRVSPPPLLAGRGRGAPPARPGRWPDPWRRTTRRLVPRHPAAAGDRRGPPAALRHAGTSGWPARSCGCPIGAARRAKTREVDLAAPGWAVVGYSRAQALAERAVLPVDFGALDGEADGWTRRAAGRPAPVSGPPEVGRAALFTALRTGFARDLLRRAFAATRDLRAERRARLGLAAGQTGMGLGKLLVVAPDQENARQYLGWLRDWLPPGQAESGAASPPPTSATRRRRWPPSGCGRSPPCWSPSPWPMRDSMRPPSRSAPR